MHVVVRPELWVGYADRVGEEVAVRAHQTTSTHRGALNRTESSMKQIGIPFVYMSLALFLYMFFSCISLSMSSYISLPGANMSRAISLSSTQWIFSLSCICKCVEI